MNKEMAARQARYLPLFGSIVRIRVARPVDNNQLRCPHFCFGNNASVARMLLLILPPDFFDIPTGLPCNHREMLNLLSGSMIRAFCSVNMFVQT
ncbi:MAG: hypothetical protein GC191_19615 [Azospirillum sp.]|nr:hypothetical protein [Azospirillum sp.]